MSIQREMMITFGAGDIFVTLVRYDGIIDSVGFVASDRPHPIGSGLADEDPSIALRDLDLMMRFTDPASVDVVIDALTLIKKNLEVAE